MAKFDQGGGCACGLQRVCDCKPAPVAPAVVAPFDVASIKPPRGEMDGSGKFSPNLYRWMVKRWGGQFAGRGLERHPSVFRGKDGALWIGHKDDLGWFTGSRLMRVLTNGARQEIFAMFPREADDLKPVPNFWRAYRRIGRCAIDKRHEMCFRTDGARWVEKGKTRTCRWCGNHKQVLKVKTKYTSAVFKTWVTV